DRSRPVRTLKKIIVKHLLSTLFEVLTSNQYFGSLVITKISLKQLGAAICNFPLQQFVSRYLKFFNFKSIFGILDHNENLLKQLAAAIDNPQP
ncbi:MAG: hypothetical protein WAT91_16720, partial [Saprospiraceae bacterium]